MVRWNQREHIPEYCLDKLIFGFGGRAAGIKVILVKELKIRRQNRWQREDETYREQDFRYPLLALQGVPSDHRGQQLIQVRHRGSGRNSREAKQDRAHDLKPVCLCQARLRCGQIVFGGGAGYERTLF